MRKLLIAIVVLGGLASVAMCASYGWDQATILKDQISQAFFYGMVAVFTLVLHIVAFRIWIAGWRGSGALIGSAAFLAFVMTAFTSLGGLATRTDHTTTERQHEIDTADDTKRQIRALERERDGMTFRHTTQAVVDAAQLAANTAKQARAAECGNGDPKQRGRFCHQKEDSEAAAIETLAEAQANKAATDRFDQIEKDLIRLRPQTGQNSAGTADPLKAMLTDILNVTWATFLTGWQKVFLAGIYDICMIASMIGIEVLGQLPAKRRDDEAETPAKSEPAQRVEISESTPVVIETVAEPATPAKLPPPARPKLATARNDAPAASIVRIMTAALELAKGQRVDLEAAFHRYAADSKAEGRDPVEADVYIDSMARFCKTVGIKTKTINGKLYLLGVQLVANTGKEQIA
jgi:hypothetical protein